MRIIPLLIVAACGSRPAAPTIPPPAPPPLAVAPLPAIDLPGTAPRIGFAARPVGAQMETPIDPAAEVVLEVNPDEWANVPLGTPVSGHGAGGTVALTYVGLTKISLGCDGGVEGDWARFDAAAPLPEGPVLLERSGGVSYVGETITAGEGRQWSLGALGTLTTATTDPKVAQVTIAPTVGAAVTREYRKDLMDGYDGTAAFNLADPDEIFLPTPVVALHAADGTGRVVTKWHSFEGIHYEVFGLGPTSVLEGESYLYWCAF